MAECTEDAFLGGRLRLRQLKSGHRAGHDAMLLAAGTSAHAGDRVVEFGAGVGAAGLALARRVAGITLALVEIDETLAELARGNAALNAGVHRSGSKRSGSANHRSSRCTTHWLARTSDRSGAT